jgi:hypothetical protein
MSELLDLLQEKRKRLRAQQSLLRFTEYTNPQYEAANHHKLICEKLEAVERGEIDRLMIFMPPRHGKSELASRRFPAWFIGKNPSKQIITASYGADLANDFGRNVRDIVASTEYQNVFTTRLREDSRAAGRWNTSDDGAYVATGVGGAITGRGAHIALIDDPIKDRADADSEVIRDKVYAWYTSTLYTRLMPKSAIILIQTRWHEDDLAGRLLEAQEKGEGDQWDVLSLPAIDDQGKALWPDWFDEKRLNKIRVAVKSRNWAALYQQNPSPDEGAYFKRDWFWRYDLKDVPAVRKYISADFAVTEEAEADDPDYTEIGVHGAAKTLIDDIEVTKLWMCLDGWSGRKNPMAWVHEYFNLVKRHKPQCEFAEVGVIRRAVEGLLAQQRLLRQAFGFIEWMPHIGDKVANARALQAMAEMGLVGLPNNEYGDYCLEQLIKFPAGKHDDVVDMLALLARAVDEAHPQLMGMTSAPERIKDRWDRAFDDEQEYNWKTA